MKVYKADDYEWNGFWGELYEDVQGLWSAYRDWSRKRNKKEIDDWNNMWNRLMNPGEGPRPQLDGRDIPRLTGQKRQASRQSKIQPRKRKQRNANPFDEEKGDEPDGVTATPEMTKAPSASMHPPMVSVPSTIKCVEFPSHKVKGRKSAKIDDQIVGLWKSYKITSVREIVSTVGLIAYRQIGSRWRNDNVNPYPTLAYSACNGFNSVDKLWYINGSGSEDVINISAPTYSAVAAQRNYVTDPNDMNAVVALRNQNVTLHMQNASTTDTASVTLFLMELKKDMQEIAINQTGALYVAEDHIIAGWSEYFDTSVSTNPPTYGQNDQSSKFFMRENPVFDEYFNVAYAQSFCFQPGQTITRNFHMAGVQCLSYQFLGKSTWCYDTVGAADRYLHVVHKKGEKIWIIKQHGNMDYNALGANTPGYAVSDVQYWFESEWEAAKVDINNEQRTVVNA